MQNIDCNQSEEDRSSIEHVEIPLGGNNLTVPAVCEFDGSVNRPMVGYVSPIIGVPRRYKNLMTTRNVLVPIPTRRSLVGCGTRT
jgi:hypothetical protein